MKLKWQKKLNQDPRLEIISNCSISLTATSKSHVKRVKCIFRNIFNLFSIKFRNCVT